MNATYTPGPWQCRIMENNRPCAVETKSGRTVAWVDFWQDESYATQLDIETQAANAAIIAAAPNLLDALKRVTNRLAHHTASTESCDLESSDELALEEARAAIDAAQPTRVAATPGCVP